MAVDNISLEIDMSNQAFKGGETLGDWIEREVARLVRPDATSFGINTAEVRQEYGQSAPLGHSRNVAWRGKCTLHIDYYVEYPG